MNKLAPLESPPLAAQLLRIRNRLTSLYGLADGSAAFQRIEAILENFRTEAPASVRGFDEKDVVLITYGDSIISKGQPGLSTLFKFAQTHLGDVISTIHILPFFPYSSDYGFSVVDYMNVDPKLGNWDDIERLKGRFKLMFDFVLNHVSAQSSWFKGFLAGDKSFSDYFICADQAGDYSSVTRPRNSPLLTPFETANGRRWVWTTFSDDQIDLNFRNPEVLLTMVGVMLRYVERGAALLRLDAVGYLWKERDTSCINLPQAHNIVKLFRDILDIAAPHVGLVTETNVPHRDNIAYFGLGDDEAQMVYQFSLPILVLDAFARQDTKHLSGWADTLSFPATEATFFNFLASHDGIGVVPSKGILSDEDLEHLACRIRDHGGKVSYKTNPDGSDGVYELNSTYFDALSAPRTSEHWELQLSRYLCSQAIMLALKGVPGVYIHSLFGSHNDEERYQASKWKRDLNHGQLSHAWLEAELANPESHESRVFVGYSRFLKTRRGQPAFHPASAQEVLHVGSGVFGIVRGPYKDQVIVALHNLSSEVQRVDLDALPHGPATYCDLLDNSRAHSKAITLAPYQVMWLEVRAWHKEMG